MNFTKLTIYTTSEGIEPVSGRLYQLDITGIEIEDEADFLDFVENNKEYWDYMDEDFIESKRGETRVNVYIQENENGDSLINDIRNTIDELKELDKEHLFGRLEIALNTVAEEDWANNWKQYYKPIEIGEKILIKPSWQELDRATDRVVFENNPGASFGTGMHFSTQLCLEEIEKNIKEGDSVLDIGCGSGILSIISLLLGAKNALAVDLDPNSVDVALQNAKDNHINTQNYEILSGNVLQDKELQNKIAENKYDIVLANIVADVIIELTKTVKNYMKPDGLFIVSGIIDLRIDDVVSALNNSGFEILNLQRRGDWAAITCKIAK